jgi:hypothetical protein
MIIIVVSVSQYTSYNYAVEILFLQISNDNRVRAVNVGTSKNPTVRIET